MSTDWRNRVASVLDRVEQDRWTYKAAEYLQIIDDVVLGMLSAEQLASKHPNRSLGGKMGDKVHSALAHVTTAVHGKGPVPPLDEGGWYHREPGRYIVAPSFAAAWKEVRGIDP